MSSIKYPKPDRTDHTPQQDAHAQTNPEIDLSASENTFSDGRPYHAEIWVDREMEIVCKTFFYSTIDIENWNPQQHHEYLDNHNLLSKQKAEYKEDNPDISKITDNSGNEMWSVTVIIDKW